MEGKIKRILSDPRMELRMVMLSGADSGRVCVELWEDGVCLMGNCDDSVETCLGWTLGFMGKGVER